MDIASTIGPASAREVRNFVRAAGRRSGLTSGAVDRAEQVGWEAVLNALEHGVPPVQVLVSSEGTTAGPATMTVTVIDAGAGPEALPLATDPLAERGEGRMLIAAMSDGLMEQRGPWGYRLDLRICDRS